VAVEPDDPNAWYVSASTGPFAAHGGEDPEARIYAWRDGEWRTLAGGLPEPLPAMPYALVATDGCCSPAWPTPSFGRAAIAARAGMPARSKGTRSRGSTRSRLRPR
jgi:hypothetical protein